MRGVGAVLLLLIFRTLFSFESFFFPLYFSCHCVLFFCHLFICLLLFLSVYILCLVV
jgi:hypothetical protein